MRIIFARGKILKYWLLTESQFLAKEKASARSGIAAVVSEDFQFLLRIHNLGKNRNLTPWLRRRQSLRADVPLRLQDKTVQQLRVHELVPFIQAARRGVTTEPVEIRIHSLGDRSVVHTEQAGFLSAETVQTDSSEFRSMLAALRKKYRSVRLTVLGKNLATMKRIIGFGLQLPVSFYREGMARPDLENPREMREVLVLSNISGAPLAHVGKHLDFWSRGIPGFRFRHIFGQLTRKRVEGAMVQRAWDCIIYRGHGRARSGGIYLELSDGLWKVPRLVSALYIHLACLTNFHKLELDDLPAPRLVTPVSLLPDFEDRRLVEIFFDRYKVSGSIDLSMRALQNQFPQFMAFTRGA